MNNADLIAAISSAIVAVLGALTAFLKRKSIAKYFTDRKRIKLEKKKSQLEAKQAKLAEKNYRKFLKLKNINPEQALEALKNTNNTLVEISKTIEKFEGDSCENRCVKCDDSNEDDEVENVRRHKS